MPTDKKPETSAGVAATRLRTMLTEKRVDDHPQNRMCGLGGQGRIPRHDETTPNTVRGRISLPPTDELSPRATDDVLRATGAFATMPTETPAPDRKSAADDNTAELPPERVAEIRRRAKPANVEVDIHFRSSGVSDRAGLALCIAMIAFAVAALAVGLAMIYQEVTGTP